MDWGTIILLAFAILGSGLVAGGVVAYRGSTKVGIRAFAAASIATGIMMWAIVSVDTQWSHSGGPSAPVVVVERVTG
jgi:hypothetical protein